MPTKPSNRRPRATWVSPFLALLLSSACGGSQPTPVAAAASSARGASPLEHDAAIARLQGECDDAEHRARDAQLQADSARGQCQLAQHELESLRARDAFEDSIWYRLEQAEISEGGLRQRLPRVAPSQRQALEATLKDVETIRDDIGRAMRRVRTVPDVEWARYTHDLESKVDGLDRTLRSSQ